MNFEQYRPRGATFQELQLTAKAKERRDFAKSKSVQNEHIASSSKTQIAMNGSVSYRDYSHRNSAVISRTHLDDLNFKNRNSLPKFEHRIPSLARICCRVLVLNSDRVELLEGLNWRATGRFVPLMLKEMKYSSKGELAFSIWLHFAINSLSEDFPQHLKSYRGLVLEDSQELDFIRTQNEQLGVGMNALSHQHLSPNFILAYADLSFDKTLLDGDIWKLRSVGSFLVVLKLNSTNISNAGISSLLSGHGIDGAYEKLEVLCLKGLNKVNDFVAKKLAKLKMLRMLDIRNTCATENFIQILEEHSLETIAWRPADSLWQYENQEIEFQLFGPSFTCSRLLTCLYNLSSWLHDASPDKSNYSLIPKPLAVHLNSMTRIVTPGSSSLQENMFSNNKGSSSTETNHAYHKSYGNIYSNTALAFGQVEADGANEMGASLKRDEISAGGHTASGSNRRISLYEIGNRKVTMEYDEAFSDLGSEGEREEMEEQERITRENASKPVFYQQPIRKKNRAVVRTEEFSPFMLLRHLPISSPSVPIPTPVIESPSSISKPTRHGAYDNHVPVTLKRVASMDHSASLISTFIEKSDPTPKLKKAKPLPPDKRAATSRNPFAAKKTIAKSVVVKQETKPKEEGNLKRRANLSAFSKK